jgi:predicted RNase H-like HicB family nuclease
MGMARYVYWRDGNHWLGYFEEYPDYVTQGEDIEDLQEQLKDLFRDLTGGDIPGIRRIAELSVA